MNTKHTRQSSYRACLMAFLMLMGWLATDHAFAQDTQDTTNGCGSLKENYGPYDYRTERFGKLKVVENHHFAPQVESLVKGQSSYLGDDLSFVLRVSPNHHRALLSIMRYGEKTKSPQPPYLQYSIDCYFDRAIRFQPDDTVVRSLYAQYLIKTGRPNLAIPQLEAADSYAKDNPLSHYNIGLIYFELKDYGRALDQEHKAMRLGLTRPGLADALRSVNRWREPSSQAASAPSAASGIK